MPVFLRQSTAVDVALGPFLDSTDGVTAETGLTISQADVRLKKNNGNWAQVNDNTAATHEENGWYEKELDATDTDTVGRLLIAVAEGGALPVWHEFWVLEEAIYDALFAASANAFSGAAGSTTLTALAAGSITAAVVATGAIDADAIADNAIDAGAIAADAITAAKIATGAIDADAIADNAIDAASIATGAITSAKFAAGAIDAAAIANGAIDAATFAAGAIDAAAIAANAIGASELAADAVAEIADAVWEEALADHSGTAGSTAEQLLLIDNFLDTEIAAILEDTGTTLDDFVDDLEGRLTAALATALQAHALGIGRGVMAAGSTTTALVFSTVNGAAPSATNDFYNGRHIVFTSGNLTLQATSISDYVGATVTATVPALTGAPAENDTFIIV